MLGSVSPDNDQEKVQCHCLEDRDNKDPTKRKGRNLVVYIDGTSNQYGAKNTNVIELYSQVLKGQDDNQLTYYNSGIGTYAESSWKSLRYWAQIIDNKVDLAIAWNFERIIKHAYRWLSENYQEGDVIYLFGFSRGAYQVRVLAAMIHEVGLIHKGNEEQIPFAYALYVNSQNDQPFPKDKGRTATKATLLKRFSSLKEKLSKKIEPTNLSPPMEDESPKERPLSLAGRFKETFSRDVKVHFVGVWDTVSSIGIVRGKDLPGTLDSGHICYFRHALALDERRVKFLPEYVQGGVMEKAQDKWQNANSRREIVFAEGLQRPRAMQMDRRPRVKEVWFTGTHSDIGGGINENQGMNSRSPSSLWMSYEVMSAGLNLKLHASVVEWDWEQLGTVHESLKGTWHILEWLPVKRLTYKNDHGHTWRPHRGAGRLIQPGQKIHVSVAFCKDYGPRAQLNPHDSQRLSDLIGMAAGHDADAIYRIEDWDDIVEMDVFDYSKAHEVIMDMKKLNDNTRDVWLHRLKVMLSSAAGRRNLCQLEDLPCRLLQALETKMTDENFQPQLLNLLAQLREAEPWKISLQSSATRGALDQLIKKDENVNIVRDFVMVFADYFSGELGERVPDWDERLIKMLNPKAKLIGLKLAAIDTMPSLAALGNLRLKLSNDILTLLSENLTSQDKEICKAVLKVLPQLMVCDEFRPRLLQLKFLAALEEQIRDDDANAPELIDGYAQRDDCRGKMIEDKFLEFLQTSNSIQQQISISALGSIARLAKYDTLRSVMLDHHFLNDIRDRLDSSDEDVRLVSLDVVDAFAKYDDSYTRLIEIGIVDPLQKMCNDTSWQTRQRSLEVVAGCAKHEVIRSEMLESHFLEDLRDRLTDSDWDVRRASMKAITVLAEHDAGQNEMLQVGVLDSLQKLFHFTHWQSRHSSLSTVAECAKYEKLLNKMLKSHFLEDFRDRLIHDDNYHVREASVKAIAVFAEDDTCQSEMINIGVLDSFRKLFHHSEWELRELSVSAIVECAKYEILLSKMLESHVLEDLRDGLSDDFFNVRQASVNAIEVFAEHNACQNEVLRIGFLDSLQNLFHHSEPKSRCSSIDAVAKCAKHEMLRNKILGPHVLEDLRDRLSDYDSDVRRVSVKAIAVFAEHAICQNEMLKIGFLDSLQNMFFHTKSKLRISCVNAIAECAKHEILRNKILESRFLDNLRGRLNDSDEDVRLACVKAITVFAENEDCRRMMNDSGIMDAMLDCVYILFIHRWHIREDSADISTHLAQYEEVRVKMLKAGYVAGLQKMLNDRYSDARVQAASKRALAAIQVNTRV